jgi:hypothetical protein
MKLSVGVINFDVLKTRSFVRQAEMSSDGRSWLWDRVTLDAEVVLNPQLFSYEGGGVPTAVAGHVPAITEEAIATYLKTPRLTVIYQDESGNVVLRQPDPGYNCDVNSGPYVENFRVDSVCGLTSWTCSIRVVAHVNATDSRPILLSHTWRRSHLIDREGLTSIVTEGTAVFRADELDFRNLSVDQFRGYLAHPVPTDFIRESVQVSPSEDGNKIHYRLQDLQLPIGLYRDSGFRKMEVFFSPYITRISADAGVLAAVASFRSTFGGAVPGIISTGLSGSPGAAAMQAGLSLSSALNAGANSYLATSTPQYRKTVLVRGWGDPSTLKAVQAKKCLLVALQVLVNSASLVGTGLSVSFGLDMTSKFVECTVVAFSGPEAAAFAEINALRDLNVPGLSQLNTWFNNITGVTAAIPPTPDPVSWALMSLPGETVVVDGVAILTGNSNINPPLPNSSGTRGSYLGKLAAQALQSPESLPPLIDQNQANKDTLDATP